MELALGHGDHDRAAAFLDAAEDYIATSREPQFIGPQAAMRAELCARAGTSPPPATSSRTASTASSSARRTRARISMVSLAGLAVEADAAVRARDLGEDDALPIRLAEMLLARLDATAGDGRPIENANLLAGQALFARATGARRPRAVGRRRVRVGRR